MKKKKFSGKLSINKETISMLQDGEMLTLVGGKLPTKDTCGCTNQENCRPTIYTCPTTAQTF